MKISFAFVIFFAVFITLYGLMHFYLYRKVINALSPGIASQVFLIAALLLLMFSPVLIRMLPEESSSPVITALSWITYLWMGSLFLFFSFYVLIDFYRLIVVILSRVLIPSAMSFIPSAKITLVTVIFSIVLINIYGLYEARNIKVEKIILNTEKLPSSVSSFRIVQISDIHFSRTNGLSLAQKIVGIINDLEPDLLVSTGDLIDDGLLEKEKVEKLFKDLRIRHGKYASTGNHEFIADIKKTSRFTTNSGFILLRNETAPVTDFLNIAAVDDPAGARFGTISDITEEKVLSGLSADQINILLKHQPGVEEKSIGRFDLQLSGHTHRGQIFPFSLIVSMIYPYLSGLYELEKGSYIYVNRGTGTWGPPIRFLSPSEITVIDFVRQDPETL